MSTTSKRKVSSCEDNDIVSWAMKIASPTGGQSIPMFDIYMAPGVVKTYIKQLKVAIEFYGGHQLNTKKMKYIAEKYNSIMHEDAQNEIRNYLSGIISIEATDRLMRKVIEYTDKETHQAMEAFIHNLNSMHSRAGRSMCA